MSVIYRNQTLKLLLTSAALFLAVGVLVARSNPATDYELSIYTATPILFWIAIGTVFMITVFSAVIVKSYQQISIFLAGLAMTAVFFLPLIRGYYFVLEWDPMTHLGIVKDIITGSLPALEIFYPLSHILSAELVYILNTSPEYSVIFTSIVFVFSFVISVPLIVRRFYPSNTAVSIAVFSALLVIPLARYGIQYAPNLMGRLYTPFLIVLILFIFISHDRRYIGLFILMYTAFLLLHPQVAIVFLFSLGGMTLFTAGIYYLKPTSNLAKNRESLLLLSITGGILIFIWIGNTDEFATAVRLLIIGLFESSPGGTSATLSGSLTAAGGSIPEIFVKLFLVPMVYITLSVIYLLVSLRYLLPRIRDSNVHFNCDRRGLVVLLGTGIIPIFLLFIVAFLASRYYMRYFFFSMPFVTIIGTIAFCSKIDNRKIHIRGIYSIVIILLLALSVLVVYPSPYIYQAGSHVPEAQVEGYSTALEYSAENTYFERIRSPVYRYQHATNGVAESDRQEYTGRWLAQTPNHFADQNLPTYYDNRTYVAVTGTDRERDPIAYGGIRYSHDDFAYLERDPNINKVITSGEFDLYAVNPNNS